MTTTEPAVTARTYGGWRRVRGLELFGLPASSAAVVLTCTVTVVVLAGFSVRAALLAAVPAALVSGLVIARVDGMYLAHRALRRARWEWALRRGYTLLGAQTTTDWRLPGPLATTRLVGADDGRGGRFGTVWDQRTGLLTSTLRCAAASTWLVDPRESDAWVSNWHGWLAGLGYLPTVRWVAVTVDTAPEPGSALADNVAARLDPNAPADARALLAELVARSPGAAADVDTRVSVTFDPRAAGDRTPDLGPQLDEVSRTLAGLESALAGCGVAVLGRATEADLAGVVRTAYDPAARGAVTRLLAAGDPQDVLTWDDAGPVGAEEGWGEYAHDSGVSVSWAWHEPPRQAVSSAVLERLLSPGRFPKRVTLLYRPLPAGTAARVLEGQVNAAAFREAYRRATKRDETARDREDRARAARAATEEAQGAGVVHMSLYVTVTVPTRDLLAEAVADVEARGEQAKVRLRRLYGSQAAGFAATLPAGVYPVDLAPRSHR